ncbi:hypothetical protein CKA32_005813 [Geitlerinema sp. FC II]|nr:hypothetical protein CKA32_005813 [Geitlerinema sp. FC II]
MFPYRPGLSLQNAYRPSSEKDALSCYNHHPCAACQAVIESDRLPDVPQQQVGAILFKSVSKTCSCGYLNEFFIVLNDCWYEENAEIPSSQEAIERAREDGLLLDPWLEEGLVNSSVARHQGNVDRAIEINRDLSDRFPQILLPFYNLGVLYAQQHRYCESLAAYEAVLKLDPEDSEALMNKARILMQLDRLQEAGATYEKWCELNPQETVTLAREEGLFGTVWVLDEPETRFLCIGEQSQGSATKSPSACQWEANCRCGPGPLSESYFASAFLLVGCQMPESSGLVLGLGAGAGVTMSLACFPKLRLTVVEIDPVVIRMCLTFFPLVQHYIDTGRLEIIQADAIAFLNANRRRFDFLQCDVYQGDLDFPASFASQEFIKTIRQTSPFLFVNIIGELNSPHLRRVLAAFDAADRPLSTIYTGESLEKSKTEPINWFGLTQEANVPRGFVPFANLSTPSAERVRQHFRDLKNNKLSRDRLQSYLDSQNC